MGKFPWYTESKDDWQWTWVILQVLELPENVQDGFESEVGAVTISGPMSVNSTPSSCSLLILLSHLLSFFLMKPSHA